MKHVLSAEISPETGSRPTRVDGEVRVVVREISHQEPGEEWLDQCRSEHTAEERVQDPEADRGRKERHQQALPVGWVVVMDPVDHELPALPNWCRGRQVKEESVQYVLRERPGEQRGDRH